MMLAVALILILALAGFGLVFFVALLIGMRNEPTYYELGTRATARPLRGSDRSRQERRPERPHGQPGRL